MLLTIVAKVANHDTIMEGGGKKKSKQNSQIPAALKLPVTYVHVFLLF